MSSGPKENLQGGGTGQEESCDYSWDLLKPKFGLDDDMDLPPDFPPLYPMAPEEQWDSSDSSSSSTSTTTCSGSEKDRDMLHYHDMRKNILVKGSRDDALHYWATVTQFIDPCKEDAPEKWQKRFAALRTLAGMVSKEDEELDNKVHSLNSLIQAVRLEHKDTGKGNQTRYANKNSKLNESKRATRGDRWPVYDGWQYTARYPEDKVEQRMDHVKAKHRSSLRLEDWRRYKFAKIFDELAQLWTCHLEYVQARRDWQRQNGLLVCPDTYYPGARRYASSSENQRIPTTDVVAANAEYERLLAEEMKTLRITKEDLAKRQNHVQSHPDSDWYRDVAFIGKKRMPVRTLRSELFVYDADLVTGIERIDVSEYTVEEFVEKFEKPYAPVIVTGLCDEWAAKKEWTLKNLSEGPLRNVRMKCGENDEGYAVKVRLKYFLQYLHTNQDDSPLYLFDSNLESDKEGKAILNHYDPPAYFHGRDLYALIRDARRPPYRWFLIGPKRSGSSLHIDPLGTSAWNALTTGRKRWILFPPGSDKKRCKGIGLRKAGEDGEAITWFTHSLPRMKYAEKEKFVKTGGKNGRPLEFVECIQYPGDVIFVPGGWWHAVVNLDHTVACTQNFCSPINFPVVWRCSRTSRKKMAYHWLTRLAQTYPLLHRLALVLNTQDKFSMYVPPSREHWYIRRQRRLIKERQPTSQDDDGNRRFADMKTDSSTADQ